MRHSSDRLTCVYPRRVLSHASGLPTPHNESPRLCSLTSDRMKLILLSSNPHISSNLWRGYVAQNVLEPPWLSPITPKIPKKHQNTKANRCSEDLAMLPANPPSEPPLCTPQEKGAGGGPAPGPRCRRCYQPLGRPDLAGLRWHRSLPRRIGGS